LLHSVLLHNIMCCLNSCVFTASSVGTDCSDPMHMMRQLSSGSRADGDGSALDQTLSYSLEDEEGITGGAFKRHPRAQSELSTDEMVSTADRDALQHTNSADSQGSKDAVPTVSFELNSAAPVPWRSFHQSTSVLRIADVFRCSLTILLLLHCRWMSFPGSQRRTPGPCWLSGAATSVSCVCSGCLPRRAPR
jgi:hypothetical protein